MRKANSVAEVLKFKYYLVKSYSATWNWRDFRGGEALKKKGRDNPSALWRASAKRATKK